MNKFKKLWSWIQEVKLFRWILFLPIGYLCYLSFNFLYIVWHSFHSFVYSMMFIVDFLGVFIGVYTATVIAPKGNLKIAKLFIFISVIMFCFTTVRSFISLQTISMIDILPPLFNLGACACVLYCMVNNINLLEELIMEDATIEQHETTIQRENGSSV